jgi:hypothetical protein
MAKILSQRLQAELFLFEVRPSREVSRAGFFVFAISEETIRPPPNWVFAANFTGWENSTPPAG